MELIPGVRFGKSLARRCRALGDDPDALKPNTACAPNLHVQLHTLPYRTVLVGFAKEGVKILKSQEDMQHRKPTSLLLYIYICIHI